MPNISSYNALGTSIEASELSAGSVTHAKLGTDVEKWKLLETVTFAGESTLTSGTLDAHNKYKVIFSDVETASATAYDLRMRVNGYSTGIYFNLIIDNVTVTNQSSQTSALIGNYNYKNTTGIIYCPGKAHNSGLCFFMSAGRMNTMKVGMATHMDGTGASEQIENFTFFVDTTTLTSGTFEIYGAD